jgi:hypothetical protein
VGNILSEIGPDEKNRKCGKSASGTGIEDFRTGTNQTNPDTVKKPPAELQERL